MELFREKAIFFTASGLSLIAILFVGIIGHKRSAIENELTRWGFDRTVVISAESAQSESNGADVKALKANRPSAAEGPRAVLAGESLERLSRISSVASITALSKTNGNLHLPGGVSADVTVFNVSPEFVNLFGLGDPKLLRQGDYIPSSRLAERLHAMGNASSATLGLPNELVDALPNELRDQIDWSKAKYSIRLPGGAYDLPRGARIFDDALFTTGREPKFSIPGVVLIPSVNLFVRLRDDSNLASAMPELKQFIATAQASRPRTTLSIALLSDYFAEELGLTLLAEWSQRLLLGLAGVSALLLTMLAFTLQARLRHEYALRIAVGATSRDAIFLSIRHAVAAITIGLAAGCAVGMAFILPALRIEVAALMPVVATLLAIGGLANFLLMGMTGFGARSNLLAQLKS